MAENDTEKRTYEIAIADSKYSKKLGNIEFPESALVHFLTKNKTTQKKDGMCFIQGSLLENGRRQGKNIKALHLMVFDVDGGCKFEKAVVAVKNSNLKAVIYTTHSHTEDEHRFRIVLFLKHPFVVDGKSENVKRWKQFYRDTGKNLGIPYDKSCVDVTRTHYLPSCPDEKLARFEILEGEYLEISQTNTETQLEVFQSVSYPDTYFEDFNLSEWNRLYGHSFKMAELIKDKTELVYRDRPDGGFEIYCPESDRHSSKDSKGAWVTDGNIKYKFNIGCSHDGCAERNRFDRLKTLLNDGYITVKDLQDENYNGGTVGVSERPELPSGFMYEGSEITLSQGEKRPTKPICNRINFTGLARDHEGNEWLLVCEVTTPDGHINEVYVPKRFAGKDTTLEDLRAAGAAIYNTPGMKKILAYVEPSNKCRLVHKGGWYDDRFVLTGEQVAVFGDTSSERVIYLQTTKLKPQFNIGGTLAEWQTYIGEPVKGNNLLQFVLCAAFASPLLTPMNVGGGGFHLVGKSSIGKTVALQIFGSVFGGERYITSYRGTDNAMESVCEMHNDCGLAIDELSQADSTSFGETVYMMANGEGKNRANNFGDSKGTKTWRVMLLSSGEMTISDKVAENRFGTSIKGGQSVRLVDIYADAGKGMGVIEALNGADSSKVFVDALSQAAQSYYGTAIRRFLQYITKDGLYASQELQERRKKFVSGVVPQNADGQVGRIADRFAICAIAGELAIEAGILPWEKGEAFNVCKREFEKFIAIRGFGSFEVAQGIAEVRKFLIVNASRFEDHNATDVQVQNRIGWYKDNGETGDREYFIPTANWSEVCGGYSPDAVAKALADEGVLLKNKDGKLMKKYRPRGLSPQWCRVLVQKGRSEKEQKADESKFIEDVVGNHFPQKRKKHKDGTEVALDLVE